MRSSRLLIAVALTAYTTPVFAQEGGATTGFPIGEKSRIHAELTLGVAFDSNVARLDEELALRTDPDGRMVIRPGVSVDVPGSSVKLGFGTHATINWFFLAANDDTDHERANVGADATLDFALGSRRSVVGFSLSDTFVRTPAYIDDPGTIPADEQRFKQWANKGTARFTLRPGGGALEFDLGYTNNISIFDDLENSMQHGALLEARYKFLPKTAVIFHSDFTVFDHIGSAEDDMGTLPSSPYNLTLGLIGQVTQRISVDLAAGFGDTLTWDGELFGDLSVDNRRTFIATAGGKYTFAERSFVSLDYHRSLVPIIVLNNYISDAVRLNFQIGIGGRLIIGALAAYEHRAYPLETDDGDVHVVVGDARVAYWFFEFLSLAVNYRVLFQNSETETPITSSTGAGLFLEDYARHQAFLNLTLRY
jgi:hypothetical protein